MGTGFASFGAVEAELDSKDGQGREGKLSVREVWNHSGSSLELAWFPRGGKLAQSFYIDRDNGDAVELVALLVESIGEAELAQKLREGSTKLAERAKVREDADARASAVVDEARQRFLQETVAQRQAYLAAVMAAEQAYADATEERMRWSRSIDLDPNHSAAMSL